MFDERPWLLLGQAATRCERAGMWADTLNVVLKTGRVPVRGRRAGRGVPDPIEDLLRRMGATGRYPSPLSFWPDLNQITLNLNPSSPGDRQIAAELDDQFGPMPAMLMLDWQISFSNVVVHWPKLVEELQAAGFPIRENRRKRSRPTTPATASSRPKMRDDELRRWYLQRVKKGEPTSEKTDWEAAHQRFGLRVRRDQVRQVRRELAPEKWRQQGRRKVAE